MLKLSSQLGARLAMELRGVAGARNYIANHINALATARNAGWKRVAFHTDVEQWAEAVIFIMNQVSTDRKGVLMIRAESFFVHMSGQRKEKKCCLLESKWKIKYDLLRN